MGNNDFLVRSEQQIESLANEEKVYSSVHGILEHARGAVTHAVNSAMVNAYWEIGRQINNAVGERA